MNAIVVDTDVVSFAFKGDTRFRPYTSSFAGKAMVVSFMTVAELRLWGHVKNWGERRTDELLTYLAKEFVVYPATNELCGVWSELKAESRKLGRGLDTADAWIAATAVLLGVPLVTHNHRDYAHLSRLQLVSFSPQ